MHGDQSDPTKREKSMMQFLRKPEMRSGAQGQGLAFVRSRDSWPKGREGRVQLKVQVSRWSRGGIQLTFFFLIFSGNYETK